MAAGFHRRLSTGGIFFWLILILLNGKHAGRMHISDIRQGIRLAGGD
ncbi:hypothetical protein CIT292_11078 [Citrobacter youngae ATCC 29220]|uniref:Uncharacterized protein n=1 Tax=Citrobacter youngae ATCC 29220 TaxID=500640 RepID=D4BKJ8_9ENTR|nr:hypothetical protein CIT292_11078 [Citrobacter youngae ATCC 29220]